MNTTPLEMRAGQTGLIEFTEITGYSGGIPVLVGAVLVNGRAVDMDTDGDAAKLTIPITPLAHGLRAKEYAALVGHKLFRIRRKDSSKADLLAWADDTGLHPAYALRASATIPPLKERRGYDALPSHEEISEMAREILTQWITDWIAMQ